MLKFWKENRTETLERYERWWRQDDLILGMFGTGFPAGEPIHGDVPDPGPPADVFSRHMDPEWVAAHREFELSRKRYPGDLLPIAQTDIGTVSLATFLGAEPDFTDVNVWYNKSDLSPANDRELRLDTDQIWWRRLYQVQRATAERSEGRFFCGLPAIAPNLDVLAELRGFENILMDLIEEPDWVKEKLDEINACYFDAFDRMYEVSKEPDGSSVYYWFMIWGSGKVSQAQCDVAAMISPDMFAEFVVPPLAEQCRWLDHCLYHVDGPDAVASVDALLEIDELQAVEFTPGPQVPQGGDPYWYDFYKRILDAGKSVQIAEVEGREVVPLLDAIGGKGVYILGNYKDQAEYEALLESVEPYR